MRRYCVIGFPVKHSLSPKVHNTAFKKSKVNARYESCEIAPADLADFMYDFREVYSGANITIPHKEAIIPYLNELDKNARKIGAVNVILNENGKLTGFNTDFIGTMEALKTAVKTIKGKRATVLGAGGAARAVIYGLKQTGADVVILNRTIENAKKLAAEFKCKFGTLEDFNAANCDILINTTSVGMWPDVLKTPLPDLKENLRATNKKPVVMDIIYRPKITRLLKDAKACGCKIITGDKMFLSQAEASRKIWLTFSPKTPLL